MFQDVKMSTKFIIVAVFLCEIIFASGNPVPERREIYLPGDDKNNWEAVWNATKDNPGVSRSEDPSIFDDILRINAEERGRGQLGRSDENTFLFEGDIDMKKSDAIKIITENAGTSRQRRAIIKNSGRLWQKNNVAYAIDGSLRNVASNIREGIAEWETTLPCLGSWRDVTRQSRPRDYMYFFRGGGCYSQVGRVGGGQRISIGTGCHQHGVVVHEIGHAMGLWHEQSRPDRDTYVSIFWNNIIPETKFNFQKQSNRQVDSLGVGYDYDSVMHYGAYAFSRNGQPTIASINPRGRRLGQRNRLSEKDIKQVELLYKCSTTSTRKPNPTNRPNPSSCQRDLESARNCQYWKGLGYCQNKFVTYMKEKCCKTCGGGTRPDNCRDLDTSRHCPGWARAGYCNRNRYVMLYCKKSCRSC